MPGVKTRVAAVRRGLHPMERCHSDGGMLGVYGYDKAPRIAKNLGVGQGVIAWESEGNGRGEKRNRCEYEVLL